MRQKVKIIKHGNTWIDTSTPKVCPECASLNIVEHMYDDSRWGGPFYIKHIEKVCQCNDCHCSFKLEKDERKICDVCWDELSGYISLITFVISLILLLIICVLLGIDKEIPILLLVAMFSNIGVCLISFMVFVVNS